MIVPQKDTLVAAMEFLQARSMVCEFPLSADHQMPDGPAPFPQYEHLGGLYTFAGDILPEMRGWMTRCVEQFTAFYAACPSEWLASEDPVLLQRLAEFQRAVSEGCS
jgi:hypothetical protein